jgi:hypothetical protein
VIVALPCSLAGHEQAVRVAPGSLAEQVLGAERPGAATPPDKISV